MPLTALVASTIAPATGALSAAFVTVPETIPRSAAGIFMPGMFCCCAWPALAATAQTTIGTTATPRRRARLDHVVAIILILSPELPVPSR